jgi:hypothetical protein
MERKRRRGGAPVMVHWTERRPRRKVRPFEDQPDPLTK